MDRTKILTTLQQLTGNLKPSERTSNAELRKLQNELAENLAGDPAFKVAGSRMHHEASQHLDVAVEEAPSIRHLDEILDRIDLTRERVAPLVFRRETEFQNALIGNSTPEWANGMAVAKSYGPFIDENDLHVWFDFFVPTRLVRVYLKGNSSPSLLIPVSGLLTPRQNYNIQGGSVWIASSLITPDPASQGFYTGLRVKRGTLELTADSEISNETIVVKPGTTATLSLELDQIVVPPGTGEAGLDADHVKLKLPDSVTLRFSAGGGKLRSNEAACRVFNCRTDFRFANSTPIWLAPFNQILVPYHVTAGGDAPDTFTVKTSESKLCQFAGSAKINAGSGWLIPAAKVDPQYLGEAAGTGALLIGVNKKIAANWKGLAESETLLKQPGIVVQPGMVTVADFFAENLHGKQRWILWKNRTTKHHSDITLGFGKSFPFVFVSSSSGSESVLFFCKHKASLDRPVDANGSPFRIESTIALASIVQNGTDFRAFLYDNDLLFDGDPKKKGATDKLSIILRNAFFNVTRPYSLFLTGKLENDNEITKGMVVLLHAIYLYLPTLPDPYVASYTGLIRGRLAGGFAGLRLGLAGFVKWPNPGEVVTAEDGTIDETAYVYFKFAPVDQSLVFNPPSGVNETPNAPATKNFQVGVRLFNRNVIAEKAISRATLPLMTAENALRADASMVRPDSGLRERIGRSVDATDFRSAVDDLEANPLLRHVPEMRAQVHEVMRTGVENMEARSAGDVTFGKTFAVAQPDSPSVSRGARGLFLPPDSFTLLDVSSRADQMGVSFGTAIRVERDPHGDANIRGVNALAGSTAFGSDLPLQISNMDVVAVAQNVRAVTLPQISWELISNIPLPIEGPPDPNDLITVTPGILVYDNDGIATRIFSESPYLVPVTPRSVTKHFVKEFNDENVPRQLHSVFTLPFALIAQADFERDISLPVDRNTRFTFNRPQFPEVRGGLQIKTLAPTSLITDQKPSFDGWTFQLDDNIKWFLFGIPITGSTLGNTVKTIFNNIFRPGGVDPKVPLEHIEFSGYGATIFSNWLNAAAAIADVSQAKFDVLVGRTAHEVVQVRSMMFTKTGCVRVVRTITLMRSPNGYVFRSDSGWKAESDAFFDSDYHIAFGNEKKLVDDTFEFHRGAVNGMSNVREIRDFPAGGFFAGSFSLNQSGLPQKLGKTLLSDWKPSVFANLGSLDEQLPVLLQPVVFDADVHFNDVVIGGVRDPQRNDFKVQTRKSLGYVQLAPSRVMIPPFILAQLLRFQNGSIGGPVDCTLDIAKSKQTIRLARVDLNPAKNGVGKDVFSCAARGSLILPPDGSWSVVTQKTDTRDVKPLDQGKTVPLIRREGEPNFRIADPADVIQPTSNNNYGVLHSTGTQKLLFDTPQFSPNVQKLKSANTYFADAYKLLNAKSVFPNLANALALTNAEKEIEVLGNGLMKMAERTLNLGNLLPGNYEYPFVNEPGILKIYVKYKKKSGDDGSFALGIDSLSGDIEKKWKAALSDIRIVVDLGPFQEIMWVEGNMNASSGIKTKFDIPHLQFGPVLDPAIKILQVLAMLSGDDFDREMSVGMSNTPDSWEYKFNCSKEIPVIKFPSPFQLSLNPNPPLKLEAGIKVGFYFNEVISIPTDLKQLVPACGAYVDFYGRLQVMCFTLAAASVYAVGQVNLGIAADTKAGISLRMKFGFGVEIVVGLPVVGNVSVLYMCEVEIGISSASIRVGAFLLFRGQAEICGGLVGVCIQIEAGGAIERTGDKTECIAQVTFAIDITVLWVIDISFEDTWEESRQIA
jgi:hypothetical protein